MTTLSKILPFIVWLSVLFGHLCVCLVVAMIFTHLYNPAIGSIAGITAGVGKELFDKWTGGIFDLWDLGADVLGTVLGIFIVIKFG